MQAKIKGKRQLWWGFLFVCFFKRKNLKRPDILQVSSPDLDKLWRFYIYRYIAIEFTARILLLINALSHTLGLFNAYIDQFKYFL